MTEDMLSWLKATIEAEKAAAEAAVTEKHQRGDTGTEGHGRWAYTAGEGVVKCSCGAFEGVASGNCGCCWPDAEGRDVDLAHIALHDPQDTIARCEAELALLDQLLPELESAEGVIEGEWNQSPNLSDTLIRTLAYARRHRPGYLPEWAPEGTTP